MSVRPVDKGVAKVEILNRSMTSGLFRSSLYVLVLFGLSLPPSLLAQGRPQDAEAAFAEAIERYSSGLYEAAARSFSHFRREWPLHPGVPEALFYEAGSGLSSSLGALVVVLIF